MPSDLVVRTLSTTAVKGLALHHPDSVDLTEYGAAGDRKFFLIDASRKLQSATHNAGLFGLSATWDEESRRLEVTRDADVLISGIVEPARTVETEMFGLRTITTDVVADPAWSDFFSDAVGRRVELRQARDSAVDVRPVTLLGTTSVAELARQSGLAAVDAQRFRMLIEFTGGEPHVEDSWDGQLIQVGDAVLRAAGRVKRCAATTRNPESGSVDLQTLKLITAYRGRLDSALGPGAMFGVYGDVVEPGSVSVGDVLQVLPAS